MTTLITGGGLIASHTARLLQCRGEQVVLYDLAPCKEYLRTIFEIERAVVYKGDITNLPELLGIVQKHRVEQVVHTAGLIGAQVSREPYKSVQVNVNGSLAVIEAARLVGAKRLIFSSSMAIYDFDQVPSGSLITEESAPGPKNLYAATKLATEHLLGQYGLLYNLNIVHLRLAAVFGRGQYIGGSWMGRVLNRVLEATLTGQETTVKAEWLGTNEYVYVKDVAEAFASAVLYENVPSGGYNIGTGVLHDAEALVKEIQVLAPNATIRLEGQDAPVVSYLKRNQAFDISKAKRFLGYEPQFTLRTGLTDYLDELRIFGGRYERLG